VSRVIRLLLDGVQPEKILCITFTKAAAANMAQRVFTTLGRWVRMPDDELNAAIRNIGASVPNAATRMRARKLFASALETPGGLKVQTIHALCTRLLQQFPFEANVPAHFSVLDDRDQNDMMERANLAVLLDASANPESPAGRALNIAMANAADATFKDVVREACLSRDHFMAWTDGAGSVDAAMEQIAASLGITMNDRIEDVEREIVDGPYLPRSEWRAVATLFDEGLDTDRKRADILRTAAGLTGSAQVDEYLGLFIDSKNKLRASLVTKSLAKASPQLAALTADEILRMSGLIDKRRAVLQRDRTQALLVIASAVASNYRREKLERGMLDYDDLIDKTHDMLTHVSSGWVHFKLDRGIDHVLIDEAQDTSPRQWDIIDRLTAEFTTGAGARDGVKRTIFAVGDEKQSIFSFQGAAPREFDSRRRDIKARFEDAQLKFESVEFKHSFRSGRAILQSVDHVFREAEIFKSIHAIANGYPVHDALGDAAPALVDLWELEKPPERQTVKGWTAALDAVSETDPEVRLAERVRDEITSLIAARVMTGPVNNRRPVSYGDVLILVRRRGKAFDAVIQALKQANIPVAGADRLKLTEHIAVIDLMNLADALLLPRDDLALAVALKSPLFGLDDADLLVLAPRRDGSLRDALALHDGNSKIANALNRLERYEQRIVQETPFSFFAWLLGGDGGRARILARLGFEANDALDEFLELALSYEQKAPASLQGFMAWLRAADTEVKRDMEIARDEVRVMTVHGAKGLEASVVFLVDTTTSPVDSHRVNLIRLPPQGNAAPGAPGVVLWAGKKDDDLAPVATARNTMKEDTEDEYRRLLYVAMTRAADRLIVGGVQPRRASSALSWYTLIEKGLEASGLQHDTIETPHGPVRRFSRSGDTEPSAPAIVETSAAAATELPVWLRTPAPREELTDVLLRPSDSSQGESENYTVVTDETRAARERARKRGTLIHRLLQSLPDLGNERRESAARDFLRRNAQPLFSDDECAALAKQVIALIETPSFAPLFADGSRAEVSIAGRVSRHGRPPALVSGQIDRLVVTPDELLIVDYKTNHAPPRTAADAPPGYVRQLALYRDVLQRLYPGRAVRCALLWTETAQMMEIPASALDAELQSRVL